MAMRWFSIAAVFFLVSCSDAYGGKSTAGPRDSETTSTASSATGTAVSSSTTTSSTTTLPIEFPASRSEVGLGWEAIEVPSAVAFCHQAKVATDDEILFWGGNRASCEYESAIGDPGLAYDPDTATWRQLPPGPLEPVVAPTGMWTRSEVLICCGMRGPREIGSNQTAAYAPEAGTWRSLSEAPLGGPFPVSEWTGSEMMVATRDGVAAYDPSTDEWQTFSQPPQPLGRTNEIAWTGSELIVWPSNVARRVFQGVALDPVSDTWRTLPDPPAWPAALDMVYTDDTLIIWGGLPAERGSERAVGSRLDLATNQWTELPEALPEPDGSLTWTGEHVLVSPGFFSTGLNTNTPVLLAYDPETDTWILVSEDSPIGLAAEGRTVGARIFISGHVITGTNRLFVSPAGWQPSGEEIPPGGPSGR